MIPNWTLTEHFGEDTSNSFSSRWLTSANLHLWCHSVPCVTHWDKRTEYESFDSVSISRRLFAHKVLYHQYSSLLSMSNARTFEYIEQNWRDAPGRFHLVLNQNLKMVLVVPYTAQLNNCYAVVIGIYIISLAKSQVNLRRCRSRP